MATTKPQNENANAYDRSDLNATIGNKATLF